MEFYRYDFSKVYPILGHTKTYFFKLKDKRRVLEPKIEKKRRCALPQAWEFKSFCWRSCDKYFQKITSISFPGRCRKDQNTDSSHKYLSLKHIQKWKNRIPSSLRYTHQYWKSSGKSSDQDFLAKTILLKSANFSFLIFLSSRRSSR